MQILEGSSVLIRSLPAEIPVWHWTDAIGANAIREIVKSGGSLDIFRAGALGPGLYLSFSAVDTMERGDVMLSFRIPQGTPVLIADPELFGFGVPEIMEMELKRLGIEDLSRDSIAHISDPSRPITECQMVIPEILKFNGIYGCLAIYGLNLSIMVTHSKILIPIPPPYDVKSVWEYHRAHPNEVPMLAPQKMRMWLLSNPEPYL